VLGNVEGSSSLAASLSMVAELLEGQVDTMVANGVRWGDSICIGCHLVALPIAEVRVGAAWVWAKCDLDR
jgi:hypothetical protein